VHAGVPLTFRSPPPPHRHDHHWPRWWHGDRRGRDDHHSCHRF
jgi:hypothetical protein